MRQIYLSQCRVFGLLWLLLLSASGWAAPCSNQVTLRTYNSGSSTSTSTTLNNGQSGGTIPVCSSASGTATVYIGSTSDAVITVFRLTTVNNVTSEQYVTGGTRAGREELALVLPLSASTTYRFRSRAINCSGGTEENFGDITLQPSLALTSSVASVCAGGAVTVSASIPPTTTTGTPTAPSSAIWYINGVLQPETTASITRFNLTNDTQFSVTANSGSACGNTTQSLTVPVNNLTVPVSAVTVCSGATPALTANYSGTSATFNWYNNATNQLLSTSTGTTSSYSPTVTQSTTYRVEASTADCGSVFSRTIAVTVGTPTVAVSPSNFTVCKSSAGTLTATSNDPTATYRWYTVNGTTETLIASATTSTLDFATGNQNGTTRYRVKISTPTCGADVASFDALVTTADATYSSSPTSTSAVCSGTPVTLTAATNVSEASYVWYITNPGSPLASTATYTPTLTNTTTAATTVTYKVDIITSCGTSTQTLPAITVNPAVAVSPASSLITTGSSITLTATGPASTIYTWATVSDGVVTTIPGATSATLTVSPVVNTVYRVTGDNTTSCAKTAEATVTVSSRPPGTLPVELVSFKAVWSKTQALLTWTTAQEKNNAYFEVERSFDGKQFQAIGQRAGAGSTSRRTDYQFTDAGLNQTAASVVYYRLRQVDLDGQFAFSSIAPVTLPAARTLQAVVFPNPYQHSVAVQFEADQAGEASISLQDVVGRTVLMQTRMVDAGAQQISLPEAAKLPAGVYYLVVRQGNQKQVLKLSHQQ